MATADGEFFSLSRSLDNMVEDLQMTSLEYAFSNEDT